MYPQYVPSSGPCTHVSLGSPLAVYTYSTSHVYLPPLQPVSLSLTFTSRLLPTCTHNTPSLTYFRSTGAHSFRSFVPLGLHSFSLLKLRVALSYAHDPPSYRRYLVLVLYSFFSHYPQCHPYLNFLTPSLSVSFSFTFVTSLLTLSCH